MSEYKPAKVVHIDVVLELGKDPPFKLESKEITIGPDNHITFDNDGHDGFVLYYHIKDPNHGYYFRSDPKDALYSAKGSGCPEDPGQWGQFKAESVEDDGTTLKVQNKNAPGQTGDFGYTMWVENDGGPLKLDPGGTNNNGGPTNKAESLASPSLMAYAIGAVAIAAVAVIALYRFGVFG